MRRRRNLRIVGLFEPCVCLVTGVPASGKSTIAQALAEIAPRSVHLRGDVFRRMIVNGRVDMAHGAPQEALEQLDLRYKIAAHAADRFATEGFTVLLQDVVIGPVLATQVERITARPRYVIVLDPDPEVVAARETARPKVAYGEDTYGIDALVGTLRDATPKVGLWINTSKLDVDDTLAVINERLDEARV